MVRDGGASRRHDGPQGGACVATRAVPVKTPEGQAELATRRLRLGQRHRTVLLLVDGKRSEAEVRQLAARAGVPGTCFDELLGLSLIAAPFPIAPGDSLLPAARTLPPDSVGSDSVLRGKPPPDSWLPAESADEEGGTPLDTLVAQARDSLVRAVRSEAPLAGTLTVLRLRRARDRTQLLELLDEVEMRLGRRQLSLAANQTLQSVRRLLERGEDGVRSAA
jgi:hypothetical protein